MGQVPPWETVKAKGARYILDGLGLELLGKHIGNGYPRKGQKQSHKRQNQARERKEREEKSKSKPKVKKSTGSKSSQSQPREVALERASKTKPENLIAKSGPTRTHLVGPEMDDPNMTMEDYIKLEEEKARRRGRVFNWEIATYGKIRDFFKDFENEFPAIIYNDVQTSKSDLLTVPILCPRHIDEFDLKEETSLSECDEEEQNVSEKDEKNGISHAYQKLKGFYKGVLNLGPDYILDAKTEDWLTRGDVNVHGMEWTLEAKNIDEYWWIIYKFGDLEVLES
ncbi:hypothetical protein Tco_0657065 [Tanacetum coccineum]|uniref:Uncharacterized protein n=1 Tax=Tanacetum coccineum TaxID=301880 RepID=A0ABQ4XBV6_9ASTR